MPNEIDKDKYMINEISNKLRMTPRSYYLSGLIIAKDRIDLNGGIIRTATTV